MSLATLLLSCTCVLWVVLLHPPQCQADVYYVTPHSSNPDCPLGKICLTINEYALGNHFNNDDNVTMLFLEGIHNLTASDLRLNDSKVLRLESFNHSMVIVQILSGTKLHVENTWDLKFLAISFVSGVVAIKLTYSPLPPGTYGTAGSTFNVRVWLNNCNFTNLKHFELIYYTLVSTNLELHINTSNISDNQHFTMRITAYVPPDPNIVDLQQQSSIFFEQSVFQRNNMAIHYYYEDSKLDYTNDIMPDNMNMTLFNVKFLQNQQLDWFYQAWTSAGQSLIVIRSPGTLHIGDSCIFKDNTVTPIQAYSSIVTLSGRIVFENNTGYKGGAISLISSSIRLYSIHGEPTKVLFEKNTAQMGGGIYVNSLIHNDQITGSPCFYSLWNTTDNMIRNSKFLLNFHNNTAVGGGVDIYGATPNSGCMAVYGNSYSNLQNSVYVKDYIFQFTSPSNVSISSDPKRICLCDNELNFLNCNNYGIFTEHYPGELFTLSLAVVGFDFGLVTGTVYANLLPNDNGTQSSLGSSQGERLFDYTAYQCAEYQFSVHSQITSSIETIALIADSSQLLELRFPWQITYPDRSPIAMDVLTAPVYVDVQLLPCPPGFTLNHNGTCECSEDVLTAGVSSCYITDGIVYYVRSGNIWVNPINSAVITGNCPFYYCESKELNVTLNNTDSQCDFNRTGKLCGSCPSNLSLAIGSSRCVYCANNNGVLLIMAFATMGIVLVFFLKVLDLTVTAGTLNGLLLYANLVWLNQTTLFPQQTSAWFDFLRVFIAWLNLDFGIETCFIQNLDGYWKTWLQFVFPAYIFLIIALIIIASRYSTRVTRVIGGNSVAVLATLFVLAYAKLFRTILTALQFSALRTRPETSVKLVWSFDGEIDYLVDYRHSILFVVALIVLLLLLSLTIILLFLRCLRRYSDLRMLRWVNRLMPVFDAFSGPLKDRHYYWAGLTLLARLILVVVSGDTLTLAPNVTTVLTIITAFILCVLVLSVYRLWQISVLENLYLMNLVLFNSTASLLVTTDTEKEIVACTSISISFVIFLTIILFHILKKCQDFKRRVLKTNGEYESLNEHEQDQTKNPPRPVTYQHVKVDHSRFRDSILESLVQYKN